MSSQSLLDFWKEEASRAAGGTPFSHLQGRYRKGSLPWDFRRKADDFLRPGVRLLELNGGNGEFLLSLSHSRGAMSMTAETPPQLAFCEKWLASLGVAVKAWVPGWGEPLPFPAGSFELVLCRRGFYDLEEVARVLRPGGFFVVQQAGGQQSRQLALRLLGRCPLPADYNLENQLPKFRKAGFRVMLGDQAYPQGRFLDLGALCFYAVGSPEEFPGFSVDCCKASLEALQRELETRGFVPQEGHSFFLVAKKRG